MFKFEMLIIHQNGSCDYFGHSVDAMPNDG